MPSILFVCTANMNRSPMASALFQRKVEQMHEGDEWRVESAGIWALDGEQATPKTRQVMQELGLDIQDHVSRSVSAGLIHCFDLILTMEQGQKEALRAEFPEYAGRVYLLTEMVGMKFDVPDPIGGSLADFRETAGEIDMLIEKGFEKISSLARQNEQA